jgi:hypothetical protein
MNERTPQTCATCDQTVKQGHYCAKCRTFIQRVLQGSQLLEEHKPGWSVSRKLKLEHLNMEFHGLCLLSQLFGTYDAGLEQLGIGPLGIELGFGPLMDRDSYGWEAGFTLNPATPIHERPADFARLTAIWRLAIIQKRLDTPYPFLLAIEPLPNASQKLSVLQRLLPTTRTEGVSALVETGSIEGLALSSALDLVAEELRANHYPRARLHCRTTTHLGLCEESGVRLALLFKIIGPLSDLDQIRLLQQSVWDMSPELALYWFSECSWPNSVNGIEAFRILRRNGLRNALYESPRT